MINEGARERLGGNHSAGLVIGSYDFAAIEELQEVGDWRAAGMILAEDVGVPYFPTTRLHADAAVTAALIDGA